MVVVLGGASDLYFSYMWQRDATIALYREKATLAAYRIEQFLQDIEQHLSWTNMLVRGADPVAQRQTEFIKLLRQAPAVTDAIWLDANGHEQVRVSRLAMDRMRSGIDYSVTPAFRSAHDGEFYRGPVYFREGTEPYTTLAMQAGEGITLIEINLKFVWDVVTQIHIGKTGYAYVVDRSGILIAHPDISLVLHHTNLSALPQVQHALSVADSAAFDADDGTAARDIQGHSVIAAHAPIETLGWTIFVEHDAKEALAPLYETMWRTAALIGLGLVLALGAAALLAKRMVDPIRKLRVGAREIATGELGVRLHVETGDELESLAEDFNYMAERLAESYAGLEKKVAERTEELIAANRAKSRFLAAASHDLRQPMHALGLFVTQLKERSGNSDTLPLIERVESAVTALQGLLDALLDVSRLDAGVVTPNIADFSANSLLERIETAFAAEADAKELRFRVRRSRCTLRSDPVLLERILINLVANALRYTTTGGILVGCRSRGEHVRIEVWDTGIGVDPEHQQAIFQEFFQVVNPERDRTKGLGLGLSIAARLARLLGGRIEVKSRPGRGSVFAVEVQRGVAARVASVIPVHIPINNPLQGSLIMFIDDDALVREAVVGLLTQWGCEVITADRGEAALESLRARGRLPDAILCDYRLPDDETGNQVIQRLHERAGQAIPAALITGDTDSQRIADAKQSGIPLLHKPVQPARMRALLEYLVAQSTVRTQAIS
jgi:signal transduction histidine kinase/ActR/RegA family two-component response regulator